MDKIISFEAIEDVIARQLIVADENGFAMTYETNRNALLSYRFWRDKTQLPSYYDLPIVPVCIGRNKYAYYEKTSKKLSDTILIEKTKYPYKRFFQKLDQPLLVENEMNVCHWEYLYDNVRRSEDYGGDNHIYLSYDSINEFQLFLCVEDITAFLDTEKFIFLFGREKEYKYPIDLLQEFNIDYTDVNPAPIRVEEIKRLFVNIGFVACAGNTFFMGMLDYHKDVLSTAGFVLSDFVFVFKNALSNRTVREVEREFHDKTMEPTSLKSMEGMFKNRHPWVDTEYSCPSSDIFFDNLNKLFQEGYIPSDTEWLKGIFLAYSMSIGRKFTGRISPAIKLETHYYIQFPEEGKRWMYNRELYKKFKYCKTMAPVRYLLQARSSYVDKHVRVKSKFNYLEQLPYQMVSDYRLFSFFRQEKIRYNFLYNHEKNANYDFVLLRFEDFKMFPKASLFSLCEYLDIPWDDTIMKITANGQDYMASGTGAFDTAPLKKRYFNVCNPFDYYRIELVMSKYWRHLGYEPIFYKGDKIYTEEEILKMFELPFQCEQYITDEKEKARTPTIRKQMYEMVKKRLQEGDAPLDANGEKMTPIPWLKPKMEYVDGELYS